MSIRRMAFVAALGVLPGAVPRPAGAQLPAPPTALESYWSAMHLHTAPARARTGGLGARLGWALVDATHPVLARSELTVQGMYAPERALEPAIRLAAATLGVGVDTRFLRRPLLGRVDPVASIGAGMVRTRITRVGPTSPAPLLERTDTDLALTPGIGALVHVDRRLSLRASASYGLGHRHATSGVGLRFVM